MLRRLFPRLFCFRADTLVFGYCKATPLKSSGVLAPTRAAQLLPLKERARERDTMIRQTMRLEARLQALGGGWEMAEG